MPVDVKVIYMDWFYRSDSSESFIEFATIMSGKPDEIFETEFLRAVLDQEWPRVKQYTIKWRMIPFIALLVLQIWNMHDAIIANLAQ